MSTKPDGGEWTWDEIVTYCRRSNHYGDETPRGAPGWSQLANLIVAAERARHPHPAAPVASGGVEVRVRAGADGGPFVYLPRSQFNAGDTVRVIVSIRLADPTEGG